MLLNLINFYNLSGTAIFIFSFSISFFQKFWEAFTIFLFFLIFQVSLVLGANIQTMQVLLNLEKRTLLILKTTCQRWKNDPRKLRKKHPWRKNQHFTSKMLTIIKVCIVFCVPVFKSVNLQYITLGYLDDGTNDSSTKRQTFQVFFFISSYRLSALITLYFHFCNFIKK